MSASAAAAAAAAAAGVKVPAQVAALPADAVFYNRRLYDSYTTGPRRGMPSVAVTRCVMETLVSREQEFWWGCGGQR